MGSFFSFETFKSNKLAHYLCVLSSIYVKSTNSLLHHKIILCQYALGHQCSCPPTIIDTHWSLVQSFSDPCSRLSTFIHCHCMLSSSIYCMIHSTLCLAYPTFDPVIHGNFRDILMSLHSKLKASSSFYLKFEGEGMLEIVGVLKILWPKRPKYIIGSCNCRTSKLILVILIV